MARNLVALSLALVFANSIVSAQTTKFEWIPDALSANDLTPDGRYVVGWTSSFIPYRWDRATGQMILMPVNGVVAVAISDDGTYVAGDMPDPTGKGIEVAGLWSQATSEWMSLGFLKNALACPSRSNSYEISADGSTVVGLSWDGCSGRGVRWTAATGMVELEALANGGNRASVVSADGTLIGGFAQGTFTRTPCIWDADGIGTLLDPTGDALGEIMGMNDEGTILMGRWATTEPTAQSTKWTFVGGEDPWLRETIGQGTILPGWVGNPMDISEDGTMVGFDNLFGNRRAWIQPQGQGDLILFETWAEDRGAEIPDGLVLEVPQAISRDGKYIIGHGNGTGAWLVTVLKPDVVAADLLNVTRGDHVSGTVADLSESDNSDVVLRRRTADTQARTEMVIQGFSPIHTPSAMEITLEGAVFARSPVQQTIALFNYSFDMWEDIDTREATRIVDSVATVSLTGDVTRFIEPGTNFMQARISFLSDNPRQQFSSNTDQFIWTVDP